jgi:hypothetical protein
MHNPLLRSAGYCLSTALLFAVAMSGDAFAAPPDQAQGKPPLVIKEQGSFAFGGKVDTNAAGNSRHCDHGYTDFQIPVGARQFPIVLWHAISVKLWRSVPSFLGGQQGFDDIFLRRGFGVYIIDPPRQGRANYGCFAPDYVSNWDQFIDQSLFNRTWRFGTWVPPGPPTFYPNTQIDTRLLDQVLRAAYPDNENFPDSFQLESKAVAKLLDDIGPAILFTHSSSGQPGWLTVVESPKVKAIVSFEPGTMVFPVGQIPTGCPGTQLAFPPADYLKLTKIPILVIHGDNLATVPGRLERLACARVFAQTLNDNGGNAKVIHLPDVGLFGNGHAMFFERNNVQIADLISQWFKDNGLDNH